MHRTLACLLVSATVSASGCARVTSVILGRVEADVAGHHVVVTDCYRTSPPAPERLADHDGLPVFEYAPCRDAVVTLRGAELYVNGESFGAVGAGDRILVDHGRVSITRGPGAHGNGTGSK